MGTYKYGWRTGQPAAVGTAHRKGRLSLQQWRKGGNDRGELECDAAAREVDMNNNNSIRENHPAAKASGAKNQSIRPVFPIADDVLRREALELLAVECAIAQSNFLAAVTPEAYDQGAHSQEWARAHVHRISRAIGHVSTADGHGLRAFMRRYGRMS